MIFGKNFARNYEKKIILETSEVWPIDPVTQRIILKIVRFRAKKLIVIEPFISVSDISCSFCPYISQQSIERTKMYGLV